MVQEPPRRTGFSGPTLVRLLARLTDTDVRESRQSLSDQLSQWLGWGDAIALSGVLNSAPPVPRGGIQAAADDSTDEFARLRAGFEKAILGIAAPQTARTPAHRRPPPGQVKAKAPSSADYGVFRGEYVSLQRSMEAGITALRGRLRARLAARSPEMARLAVIDAAMEQALMVKEYGLLAGIPALLERHFKRLRQAEEDALAEAQANGQLAPANTGAWLDTFRHDMQSVMRAELGIRLQPLEGLLAACRAC